MLPDEPLRPGEDRDPGAVQPRQADTGGVPLRVRYLALGVLMGGIWAWNGGTPLWVHALKLVVLMMIVATLVRLMRRRRARRAGISAQPQLSVPRVLAVKASLVVAALLASWPLDGRVSHAYLLVAAGLLVVVALLGPHLHPWLLAKRSAGRGG